MKDRLDGPIKKKVEACLRRQGTHEEVSILSPSPISGMLMPGMSLTCPLTNKNIPMCILTGRHMELEDWCVCPVSRMPVLFSEYTKFVESEEAAEDSFTHCAIDPIFGQKIDLVSLSKV